MRKAMGVLVAVAGVSSGAEVAAPAEATRLERISFTQAVERALAKNANVINATQEVRRANAQVEQARAPSLPTLIGNASYTRLDSDRLLAGGVVAAARDSLAANVVATVPLVAPPRWANWSRAADNAETVKANREEVRRQVASAAARAYLTVIGQHRVVEVTERSRVTAQTHLDYIRTRLAGGLGTRLDEVRAAQQLGTVVVQLEQASANLVRAQENLGVLVGTENPIDTEAVAPLEEPSALDAALKQAREGRTDVKASQERLSAAKHSESLGWTDYLPLLSGVFQPFYQNPPSLVNPLTGWQAQLVLTVPFYDGGLRYGQQHERQALTVEAQAALDAALRQAQSDVRAAFEGVRRADAALAAARDSAKLAEQALELSTLAYKAGATTNLEVVDAERAARDAETSAAVAEDAARQSRLDLLVSSGKFP